MSRNRRNSRSKNNINFDSNFNRNFLILFIAIILLILIYLIINFVICNKKNNNIENLVSDNENIIENNDDNKKDENKDDIDYNSYYDNKSRTFNLCAIGDIICHNTQYFDAYIKETDEYDFSYVFDDIKKYTSSPDICIGNLETSFAGKDRGYSNYPTFNSPDSLVKAIKDIGVDVLSTASNHSLDMGFSGLSRTIDVLDENYISHLGTYKSKEEQEKILYKYVKGTKIAFINYTYGTNGIPVPQGKEFCINLINKDLIKSQIELAKSEGAHMIVALMHWGTEYRTTADDNQKKLADFLFENGVDIILGNHPHTIEPMEKRTVTMPDGTKKDCFVVYALGNFICDQNAPNTRNSLILNLRITRNKDNKISIDDVSYVPIHMYKDPSKKLRKFKLLDINKSISLYESGVDTSIGKAKYEDLKVQLKAIKNILGEN